MGLVVTYGSQTNLYRSDKTEGTCGGVVLYVGQRLGCLDLQMKWCKCQSVKQRFTFVIGFTSQLRSTVVKGTTEEYGIFTLPYNTFWWFVSTH